MEDLPELVKDVPDEYREEIIDTSVKMMSHPGYGES